MIVSYRTPDRDADELSLCMATCIKNNSDDTPSKSKADSLSNLLQNRKERIEDRQKRQLATNYEWYGARASETRK